MQRLWKKTIVVVGMVVVLGSIGLFLSHGSGWRARRAYAQDSPRTITWGAASVDSAPPEIFTANVYNGTSAAVTATIEYNNEDGTPQTSPITITVPPNHSGHDPYTPPTEPLSPSSSLLINTPFVPKIIVTIPSDAGPGPICTNINALDSTSGFLQLQIPMFAYPLPNSYYGSSMDCANNNRGVEPD